MILKSLKSMNCLSLDRLLWVYKKYKAIQEVITKTLWIEKCQQFLQYKFKKTELQIYKNFKESSQKKMTSQVLDYEEAVDEIFEMYDRNHDNYLEFREVVKLFIDGAHSIGKESISTDEVLSFLQIVDKNKDGKVSRKELLAFMKIFSTLNLYET